MPGCEPGDAVVVTFMDGTYRKRSSTSKAPEVDDALHHLCSPADVQLVIQALERLFDGLTRDLQGGGDLKVVRPLHDQDCHLSLALGQLHRCFYRWSVA